MQESVQWKSVLICTIDQILLGLWSQRSWVVDYVGNAKKEKLKVKGAGRIAGRKLCHAGLGVG